jgi:hypothetical protein
MTKDFLYSFIKKHRLTVLSTLSSGDTPEAALVGFAVAKKLEIIFDNEPVIIEETDFTNSTT